MKNIKPYILILLAAFFAATTVASLYFGYRAYTSSKALEKNYRQTLKQLEQEIDGLKAQLATIQVQAQAEDDFIYTISKTGNIAAASSKRESATAQGEAVRRLEKIVESTGLEQLAASEDTDPTLLSEMYAEFAERRQAVLQREQLLQINTDLHKTDEDRYGPELMALYERARLRRRNDSDRQESDRAFAELLAKYPEAYATGMAIAERAMISGFRRNTSEVEKYYDLLRQNENFSNLVTDRGVEAVPNIEYYLARQYLKEGSIDSALALIESLEKNYPDSRLFTGGFDRRQRWQPASHAIPKLRQEAESLR